MLSKTNTNDNSNNSTVNTRQLPATSFAELSPVPEGDSLRRLARGYRGFRRCYLVALAVLIALCLPGQCPAASGNEVASNLTAPAGLIMAGTHLWAADPALGFCRLDPDLAGALSVNLFTCVRPLSAIIGQPAYDAASGILYLPDSQFGSLGVWRYQFNATGETFGAPAILAQTSGLGALRPRSVALGPDGNLYMTNAVNGNVTRIFNPSGQATAQTIANTSTAKPARGVQFLGQQLLLAETTAVTLMPNPTTCGNRCPNAVDLQLGVSSPTSLAVDPVAGLLYIGTPYGVFRWTRMTGQVDLYSNSDASLGVVQAYGNITGLGVDTKGNLYIANDPTAGQVIGKARLYEVPAGSPISSVGPVPTLPGLVVATINVSPIANPAMFDGGQLTTPGGATWIGNHFWVSDGLAGFCRMDPVAGVLEPSTCAVPGFAATGEAAFDPANRWVYVPATNPGAGTGLRHDGGIGRLGYDPANDMVSNVLLPVVTSTELGDAPTCVALGPDGNLYVGFLISGKIVRVTNPSGATHTIEPVGNISDISGNSWYLAFAGNDLWIAEKVIVSVMRNATACTGTCGVTPLALKLTTPRAVAWDGTYVYAGSQGGVWRYNPADSSLVAVADQGMVNGSPVSFETVSGLGLDGAGHLLVAEGPFLDTFVRGRPVLPPGTVWHLGHAWTVSIAPPRLTSMTPATGAAGATINVTLSGSHFAAWSTLVTSVGIKASNVLVVSPTEITATLAITAATGAGPQTVAVGTQLGLSNPLGFTITAAAPPPVPPPPPPPIGGTPPPPVGGTAPRLTAITPPSGKVGSTQGVKILGVNLTAGATVSISGAPGITVAKLKLANPNEIDADFAIAPSAASGPRTVTVTSAGGTTNAVTFTVQ